MIVSLRFANVCEVLGLSNRPGPGKLLVGPIVEGDKIHEDSIACPAPDSGVQSGSGRIAFGASAR